LLGLVGSLLAESLRADLQANRQRRAQERLVWQYSLQACPLLPDGTAGPAIDCQGKDISLNGIGFYLPGQVPSSRLLLRLPRTPLTAEVSVTARVARTQPCADGWLEVGAVLEQPHVFPEGPQPAAAVPAVNPVLPPAVHSRPLWLVGMLLLLALIGGAGSGIFLRPAAPRAEHPREVPPPAIREKPPRPPRPVQPSIQLAGRAEPFADLQSAIAAAPDGGVVVIRGKVRSLPVRVAGKSLTVRGEGPGARLVRVPDETTRWEPLLWSDRPLILVGLELSGHGNDRVPLVTVEGDSLVLRDCKLAMPAHVPAVALRRGHELRLERCTLTASAQGLAVEVDQPCRVGLTDSNFTVADPVGALLLAWSAETSSAAIELDLRRSRIDTGRVLACRGLAGQVHVSTRGSRLQVRQARVSFAGLRDPGTGPRLVWTDLDHSPPPGRP
jgi:hypothetical protein